MTGSPVASGPPVASGAPVPAPGSASPPADADAREQIRVDHEHTLFVVAGAGTGKTTALVARVVALVAKGRTELEDLAAITFTEAAAGELRDRIRGALEAAARGDDPLVARSDEQQRCADARARIDDAALTTLHGFAQRLLARFPIEAGVPPRFEVVDEIEAAISFDQAWQARFDELLDDPMLADALLNGLALGIEAHHWRDIATSLHANWDRVPDPDDEQLRASPVPAVDGAPVLAALDHALSLRARCDDPTDKLFAHLEGLVPWRDAMRRAVANGGLDLIEMVVDLPIPKVGNSGKAGNWQQASKPAVLAAIAAYGDARTALLDTVGRATLDAVTPRLCAWVHATARQRAAAGRLEYHDLLVLARDLLRRDEAVRASVAVRYRYVLIDEFQDTDPLQAELATLLAASAAPAGAAWHDIAVEPGRLFFVGDPKQSIYRFRRADLLLYHRAAERFAQGAVQLSTNFRSTPGVIEWVNDTFDGLLRDAAAEIQAQPARLEAHRDAIEPNHGVDAVDGPAVATFGAPSADAAAHLRVHEATDIATLVQSIVGRWLVVDPTTHETRPARRRDIALLLPTRTSLDAIDRALDAADIPARVESRSLVFATSEVRDLLSILQAIDDPADAIAVVAALRSTGFGCSDRALAQWAIAGGRWDYRDHAPETIAPEHDVALALVALRRLHDERWWRSVSDTVAAVIEERRLDVLSVAYTRPRDRWRRTRFLLEHARAWDDAGDGATLRGFVEWVRRQGDEGATGIEMPAPEADDDAVRILTMHGAKGLEFPVVVLAGLSASPNPPAAEVLFDDSGPLLRAGRAALPIRSLGYDEQRAREREHITAERARLLYVAATRARDHLLVSQHYNPTRQPLCFAAMLAPHLARHPVPQLDTEPDGATVARGPAAAVASVALPVDIDADVDVAYDQLVAIDDRRRGALLSAAQPVAVAATRLHAPSIVPDAREAPSTPHGGQPHPAWPDDDADDDTAPRAPWQRGRAGTAIGRAVHAVLQHVDLRDHTYLVALARAQAVAEHIPERTDEIATLATGLCASNIVRAAAERRHWREVPVAALVDGMIIEGYIDLLYEDDRQHLVVVDYKTDQIRSDADIDALAERYAPQAASYALALETTLGRPVAKAFLLFATAAGPVEREIPRLAAAQDAVRDQMSRMRAEPTAGR